MNKATKLVELYNVLTPDALDFETMGNFYCKNTMEIRTGDKYESPILNIFESLMRGDSRKAFLFMGHRGCGKSTELNGLRIKLEENDFKVGIIKTALEIDMQNAVYWDLLLLIMKKMLEMADEVSCRIDQALLDKIQSYWQEIDIEETEISYSGSDASAGAESTISTQVKSGVTIPGLVSASIEAVGKLFVKTTTEIKLSDEKRKKIRQKVERRAADWIAIVNVLSEAIAKKQNGKYPLIIFEDLDKLDTDTAWSIFQEYAYALSHIPTHIIYTFPIGLSYSPKYGAIEPYFEVETLPMIKVHRVDMAEYPAGIELIKEILYMRADKKLFNKEALKHAIIFTGGSLRDLFNVITEAVIRADRRESTRIEMEDILYSLRKLSSTLTKRIQLEHYDFLKNIYNGSKKQIQDRDMLLELMQAQVIMEYNGERWHDIHPLVTAFLKDEGLIE